MILYVLLLNKKAGANSQNGNKWRIWKMAIANSAGFICKFVIEPLLNFKVASDSFIK